MEALAGVSDEEFRNAMSSAAVTVDKPNEKLAVSRSLENLHKTSNGAVDVNDEQNEQVVRCLRKFGLTRINYRTFSTFKRKVVYSEKLSNEVWFQLRTNKPELDKDPDMRDWLYNSIDIETMLNKDLYWFVDVKCPHMGCLAKVGKGWQKTEVYTTVQTSGQQLRMLLQVILVARRLGQLWLRYNL